MGKYGNVSESMGRHVKVWESISNVWEVMGEYGYV